MHVNEWFGEPVPQRLRRPTAIAVSILGCFVGPAGVHGDWIPVFAVGAHGRISRLLPPWRS